MTSGTPEQESATPALSSARLRPTSQRVVEHVDAPKLERERHMLGHQLQVDLAHSVMLTEQRVLTPQQGRQILAALQEAIQLGDDFPIDPRSGGMYPQIEKFVSSRAGADVGGRLQIGRSRIDLGSSVPRIYTRDQLIVAHDCLLALSRVQHRLAELHASTVMPGWTHLQHAQPWTFGHYMIRQLGLTARNMERIEDAYRRVNLSSLGGAALVGSSWPLDRHRVAELLGHSDIVYNSHDAGSYTFDWIHEVTATLAITMIELGRLAGDLYLWHSWEFGLVEIDDAYCGTSTMMPQKKNASALEHIRGHAGYAVGWFPHALGLARSASSTDSDRSFSPSGLYEATDVTWRCVDLMVGVLETLQVNEEAMRERAASFWSTASALADAIVVKTDLSFRQAHHIVARLVRASIEVGRPPSHVTGEALDQAAEEILGRPLGMTTSCVQEQLDVDRFVATRTTTGATARAEMARQIEMGREQIARHEAWLTDETARIDEARAKLEAAVTKCVEGSAHG